MRHRVFIAINLGEKALAAVEKLVEECRRKLPRGIERQIRFMPPENWHITLSFLGHQEETDIDRIKAALEETRKPLVPFEAKLDRLIWGPPGKAPRMIWLLGDGSTSKKLGDVKIRLEDLLRASMVSFEREARQFNAHITLARFDLTLPQPPPTIEKGVNLGFEAKSMDLMESRLGRGGAEYTILEEFPLGA